jgi:hypothetical protein
MSRASEGKMVQTLNPEGKRNFRISEEKYEVMKQAMLEHLKSRGELTHTELLGLVDASLGSSFDGSISWYFECVKLDLEARSLIHRVGSKPERLSARA